MMTDRTDLLEQSFELNLNNYGPEDVERLNDWAINAYAALEAAQAEHTDEVMRGLMLEKAHAMGLAERDAALARLAEIEKRNQLNQSARSTVDDLLAQAGYAEDSSARNLLGCMNFDAAGASPQPKMVTPYITQEHFDKAFPVNVPPSQAQPPAPSDTAITYMTGYSAGREWAGATNQAQPSQAPPEPSKYGSPELQALILDKLQQAQPERAPLSDQQKRILFECVEQVKDGNEMDYWLLGFEAAERAHGIKQGGQHD